MNLNEKVRKYGYLHNKIKELDAQLKELKQEKEQLEKELRHDLEEQGFDKIAVDNITVYQLDKVYISLPNDERNQRAIEWLEAKGMGDMLRLYVPTQTLTAVLKEEMEQNPELMEEIKQHFNVNEQQRVGIRVRR